MSFCGKNHYHILMYAVEMKWIFKKILYNVEILKKNYIEILKQNAANIAI